MKHEIYNFYINEQYFTSEKFSSNFLFFGLSSPFNNDIKDTRPSILRMSFKSFTSKYSGSAVKF